MRGVALVVAVTVVAEVGDFRRFITPAADGYLGLVPSEHSSGSSIRRGGITKAGNALARRVLIEGAWTYRMPARVSQSFTIASNRCPRRSVTSRGKRNPALREVSTPSRRRQARSWSRPP
jgi:transposase